MGVFNEHSSDSDTGGNSKGIKGDRGPPGIGFKLTDDGNYDIENKRLKNVAAPINLDDAINLGTAETNFLKLDGTTHMTADLDLRGNKIINPSEINMNRKLITNMDTDENNDLSAVNMITLKKFHPVAPPPTHEVTKDIDLKEFFNIVNSKQQIYSGLTANYNNLVSYNDSKNIFLSRKETFPMETGLDMGNNTIYNIKNPTEIDQGTNKGYVDQLVNEKGDKTEVSDVSKKVDEVTNYANNQYRAIFNSFLKLSGGTMTGQIDMGGKKITNLATPKTHENGAAVNVSFFNTELNDSNTNLYTRELCEQVTHNFLYCRKRRFQIPNGRCG